MSGRRSLDALVAYRSLRALLEHPEELPLEALADLRIARGVELSRMFRLGLVEHDITGPHGARLTELGSALLSALRDGLGNPLVAGDPGPRRLRLRARPARAVTPTGRSTRWQNQRNSG
jgi:hypothetical protein